MLDGAGYNAPVFDTGNDEEAARPDRKTQPVEYLRWQLTQAPGVPGYMRKSPQEVEAMCERFRGEIERGEKVWSDKDRDWVKVQPHS